MNSQQRQCKAGRVPGRLVSRVRLVLAVAAAVAAMRVSRVQHVAAATIAMVPQIQRHVRMKVVAPRMGHT